MGISIIPFGTLRIATYNTEIVKKTEVNAKKEAGGDEKQLIIYIWPHTLLLSNIIISYDFQSSFYLKNTSCDLPLSLIFLI